MTADPFEEMEAAAARTIHAAVCRCTLYTAVPGHPMSYLDVAREALAAAGVHALLAEVERLRGALDEWSAQWLYCRDPAMDRDAKLLRCGRCAACRTIDAALNPKEDR